MGVAAAVASGRADCGLGIAAAAQALELDFIPLFQERYDLVIPKHTSALLAIVLGLLNQTSNLGNLFGPAAMATVVKHFGWGGAPYLFVGVTVCGLAVALMLRAAMKHAKT